MKNGIEQELKLYPNRQYFYFKGRKVHMMMAHSFFSYKPGYDVHHLNQAKTDNRLNNLIYLTREQHARLHMTGKKCSSEAKQKIRAAKIGKKHSAETKEKIRIAAKSKKIFCSELNKVFESMQQAARELKLSDSSICQCCKGKLKTTGGYHFSYYSQDLNCHE